MSDVSVVIPCRDSGGTLEETLGSVADQTLRPAEVVVVDDGSRDPGTLRVLERLGPEVTIVRQSGRGLPAARNAGFAATSTPFVLPLDADDRIEPRMLERCVDELRPRTGLGFVYTDIRFFDQRRGVHRQLPYNFHDELYRNQVTVCALIRREAWQDVGGYREEMLRGAEDWEFWIALGEKGWFGRRIPEPLFHYRVRKGQMSDGTREVLPEIAAEIRAMHPALYSEENLVRLRRRWKGRFNPRDPEGWLFRGKRRLHRWFGREGGD